MHSWAMIGISLHHDVAIIVINYYMQLPLCSHSHSDTVNNPVYNERSMAEEQQPSDSSTILHNPLYSATTPTYTEVTDAARCSALHKHMQQTEPQAYEVPMSTQNIASANTTEFNESKDNSASLDKN